MWDSKLLHSLMEASIECNCSGVNTNLLRNVVILVLLFKGSESMIHSELFFASWITILKWTKSTSVIVFLSKTFWFLKLKLIKFLVARFCVNGYSIPYRLDKACKRGVYCYILEKIYFQNKLSENLVKMKLLKDFLLKLIWGKEKWLFCLSYNPTKNNILSY